MNPGLAGILGKDVAGNEQISQAKMHGADMSRSGQQRGCNLLQMIGLGGVQRKR